MTLKQNADYTDQDGKRIFSVSGFLRTTQQFLKNLGTAYIQGEVSSISDKYQLFYFVLQDETGKLNCTVPRALLKNYRPAVGDKLIILGSNSINARSSQYSFWCEQLIKLDGMGLMAEKLRILKEKLEREGIFSRPKRQLPQFIDRVGVITSEVGSVIHDIELTMQRRNPLVEIFLYPARVQGEGAALNLIQALIQANEEQRCDVLIIGRGGGSFEDLLPFYDEALVRAVASSRIPIISAVGHETDTPFCDFAADVRAATPTAAAELCTAITHAQLCFNLEEAFSKLEQGINQIIKNRSASLELFTEKLHSYGPEQLLALKIQRLQLGLKHLDELITAQLTLNKERQQHLLQKLLTCEPAKQLDAYQKKLTELISRNTEALDLKLKAHQERFRQDLYTFEHCPLADNLQKLKTRYLTLVHTLQALDPLRILQRGYSITLTENKHVADFKQLKAGDRIENVLAGGRIIAEVLEKKSDPD